MLFRSDRKSTRLNSSHTLISYAVFCLKKKKRNKYIRITTKRRVEHSSQRVDHVCISSDTRSTCFYANYMCTIVIFYFFFFFFNDTATTEIYTLSLHDALPI